MARAQGEEGDTVYEYLVTEDRAGWQPWRERVPSWKYPRAQACMRAFLTLCFAWQLRACVHDMVAAHTLRASSPQRRSTL